MKFINKSKATPAGPTAQHNVVRYARGNVDGNIKHVWGNSKKAKQAALATCKRESEKTIRDEDAAKQDAEQKKEEEPVKKELAPVRPVELEPVEIVAPSVNMVQDIPSQGALSEFLPTFTKYA